MMRSQSKWGLWALVQRLPEGHCEKLITEIDRIVSTALNKSLRCLNLCIELLSFQIHHRMFYFQQTSPTFATLWEQLPLEDPCLWCGRFFCSLECDGRLHRYNQHQHPNSSWGPGPNQHRIRFREAETLYQNHYLHASSGTISVDGYSGAHPGHAWIGTDDTGVGEV